MSDSNNNKTVVVAMSGGVDSSVAALLLHKQGYNVIGVTMRLFPYEDNNASKLNKSCCSLDDVEDARSVCRKIGAKHYFLNFEKEFNEHVINYFVSEYQKGRTPFPCLACNDRLKFDFLLRRAEFLKADYIATGHYATILNKDGKFELVKGEDETKDQSYVLFNLNQKIMKKLKLPIGIYSKIKIREIASEFELINADKPDSQDICFIPDRDYKKYINKKVKNTEGNIVDSSGNVLGEHAGIHNFTIGQRKGIKIADKDPLYVIKINADSNEIVVGSKENLATRKIKLKNVNIITNNKKDFEKELFVKVRSTGKLLKAKVNLNSTEANVDLLEDEYGISPGQACVFYFKNNEGYKVLGGGWIKN